MPYSGKPVGGGRKNFKGCMESINYNGDNITDLARRKKLDTSSFVSQMCPAHIVHLIFLRMQLLTTAIDNIKHVVQ